MIPSLEMIKIAEDINNLAKQYSDFTFHRINMLLNGIVDCETDIDFSEMLRPS